MPVEYPSRSLCYPIEFLSSGVYPMASVQSAFADSSNSTENEAVLPEYDYVQRYIEQFKEWCIITQGNTIQRSFDKGWVLFPLR